MKYTIGQTLYLMNGREHGPVVARSESAIAEPQYLLRYVAADGRMVEAWWSESALSDGRAGVLSPEEFARTEAAAQARAHLDPATYSAAAQAQGLNPDGTQKYDVSTLQDQEPKSIDAPDGMMRRPVTPTRPQSA
jgi:hypothetical protein